MERRSVPWKGSESGESHGTECDKPVGGGSDGNEVEYSAARRVICCAVHLENASCVVFLS